MNMKIVGGLFSLLFIAQAVQVGAISKISNVVARNNQISQHPVTLNNLTMNKSQVAAVGFGATIKPEPAGISVYNYYHNFYPTRDGSCIYVVVTYTDQGIVSVVGDNLDGPCPGGGISVYSSTPVLSTPLKLQ